MSEQQKRAARDVDGHVAHRFEVTVDFDGRADQLEILGNRLSQHKPTMWAQLT